MDPNLLPNDLREQEEKELAEHKKRPAEFELELNSPPLEKKEAGQGGYLANIFGRPKNPLSEPTLSNPLPGSSSASQTVDWLSAGKKISKPDNLVLKKSPWVSTGNNRRVAQTVSLSGAKSPVNNKRNDSWGEIFKNLFNFGRKKRVNFHLDSFAGGAVSATPKPAIPIEPQLANERQFRPYHAVVAPPRIPPSAPENKQIEVDKIKKPDVLVESKYEKGNEVNVNLMPQELLSPAGGANQNIKSLIIAILTPVLVITLGYLAVLLLQNNLKLKMVARQAEFNDLQKQIGDFVSLEKQNNLVADRVALIKKLLDSKIIWNNFFEKLEKYTLDGVYYTSLTIDTSGVLTLPGVAQDYETLAKQLAVFDEADDFLKDAKLTSAQLISEDKAGVVGVGFQLRLTLEDNLLTAAK